MDLKHIEDNHPNSQSEPEPPPPPPSAVGSVMLRVGGTPESYAEKPISEALAADFWSGASTSSRQVVVVPLPDSDEFVAFGIFPSTSPCCRVPFVAWGKVSADLPDFYLKMEEAGAECAEYTEGAPVECMQDRVSDIQQLRMRRLALVAMGWELGTSNEDTSTRTAA